MRYLSLSGLRWAKKTGIFILGTLTLMTFDINTKLLIKDYWPAVHFVEQCVLRESRMDPKEKLLHCSFLHSDSTIPFFTYFSKSAYPRRERERSTQFGEEASTDHPIGIGVNAKIGYNFVIFNDLWGHTYLNKIFAYSWC